MSWIKGKDKEINFINSKGEKEWIQVFLTINFGKLERKRIAEIAVDILEMFVNAKSIYNSNGEYLGYVNPKINQNAILTYNKITKELRYDTISKPFFPEIKEINGNSKLIFTHKGKYSLPSLYKDLFILWNICEEILKLYVKDKGTAPTFNTIFIDNKPAIENLEKLLRFRYKVEDRLNYGERRNKEITKKCLSANVKDCLNSVKKEEFHIKNTKLDKNKSNEVKRWIKEVENLLSTTHLNQFQPFIILF